MKALPWATVLLCVSCDPRVATPELPGASAQAVFPTAAPERGDEVAAAHVVSPPTPAVASAAASARDGAAVSAAAAVPPSPPEVERLEVEGQLPAGLVRSADGKPPRIVFLPGICSNAAAYLYSFPVAARDHGGALAIDGDRPCGAGGSFHSITSDPTHEEPRIDAALDAAGVPEAARPELVYVGYSLGATLIENLVKKRPERYRHVVLIGSPRDPRKDRLGAAASVATMSCSLDVPQRMKAASVMLNQAGVRAAYFEMPGCTHGNIEAGDAVFGQVFSWMRQET